MPEETISKALDMSVLCQYNRCMLIQTLYKNGNSVAVTIPRQFLEELNLKEGSEVVVEKKGDEVHISSKAKTLAVDIDPKFMKMVDDFVTDHEDVLKELANK
jgi:putative addiction module antidote